MSVSPTDLNAKQLTRQHITCTIEALRHIRTCVVIESYHHTTRERERGKEEGYLPTYLPPR